MSKNLTKEELETLQKLNAEFHDLKGKIGELEIQKQALLLQVNNIKEAFTGLEGGFITKYGKDSVIDIQTGEVKEK